MNIDNNQVTYNVFAMADHFSRKESSNFKFF